MWKSTIKKLNEIWIATILYPAEIGVKWLNVTIRLPACQKDLKRYYLQSYSWVTQTDMRKLNNGNQKQFVSYVEIPSF